MLDAPRYLQEPVIHRLVNQLLDKADNKTPRVKLNQKSCPELFDFNGEDTDYIWRCIDSLSRDFHVLEVRLDKNRHHYDPDYNNAQLILDRRGEGLLRVWLDRPAFDPQLLIWRESIAAQADVFADGGRALLDKPIELSGRTARQMIAAFAAIPALLDVPLSLRELSARAFWGDSKVLDHRLPLLQQLFPREAAAIITRPLLLTVYVPERLLQIVFVENQDSFLQLASQQPLDTALIYTAGFRGTAGRVRETVSMAAVNPEADISYLQKFWLSSDTQDRLPLFFWGDLDYAGMGILKAMRESFPTLQCWRPGYRLLLESLLRGVAHSAGQAAKEKQFDPIETGCCYADEVLLPAMREQRQFVDQEICRPSICCRLGRR